MKVGVIYVGFNTEDYIKHSLEPWMHTDSREVVDEESYQTLWSHEFVVCAVSVPFKGFDQTPPDGTLGLLHGFLREGLIDYLITQDTPVSETAARGEALKWLVSQGVTHLWQVDSDEFYNHRQIAAIIRFVEARPHIDWHRLSLCNLVFTPDQHLVEPFTPPRIHKVHNAGGYVAAGFHQDNNVYYERPSSGERVLDTQLASCTVPKSCAWIVHKSWLNDERSRKKVEYQTKARGWQCSFAWDDSKGGLIWNEDYFKKTGQSIPEVAHD